MEIVPYEPKYKADFFRLNMEWLIKYNLLEPEDTVMLESIDSYIAEGAMACAAVEQGEVIAVCMIRPLGSNIWELCKLAVTEAHQGKGAGKAVFLRCMEHAKTHGAEKVILVSNHVLERALVMYDRYGFRHVPLEEQYAVYETADVQMEYEFSKGVR